MSQTPEIPGFNLNSPKNYLGYTVAVDVAESLPETDAATLIEKKNQDGKRITRDVSGARNGSRHLGLITANSERDELTDLGQQVAGFGAREYGSKTGALDALRSLYGKDGEFIDELPEWEEITQEVMVGHSGISRLISLMQEIHSDREDDSALPLPLLAQEVHHRDPNFARECFFKSDAVDQLNNIDWRPIGANDTAPELYEKTIYRSSIVHQFKSILYHAGILTTRGKTRQDLEFSSDEKRFLWGLTAKFREDSFSLSLEETAKLDQPDMEELVRDIAPPERVEATTSRIIRNTALVKTLKNDYNYRCQVCGARRRQSSESYYAEGHIYGHSEKMDRT